MKWNLKPWQIGLICAAGVVVIGGVGTGIWYGVTHAGNTAEEDTTPAMVESVQVAEPALDEPTATATETETETETELEVQSKPKTNKDTIKEPSKETESNPATQPKSDNDREITVEYDSKLSNELSLLLSKTRPGSTFDESSFMDIIHRLHPENFISYNGKEINSGLNNDHWFIGHPSSLTAEAIAEAWTGCRGVQTDKFFVSVHRYSNGWVYVHLMHAA